MSVPSFLPSETGRNDYGFKLIIETSHCCRIYMETNDFKLSIKGHP